MKPAPFHYLAPATVEAAVALLAEHGDEAAVLAGGQSLMPMLALRLTAPAILVDINRIGALERQSIDAAGYSFGALVRHADAWAAVRADDPAHLLARALPHVAHQAIRHRGTICGSLALADPAAELPACAVCLDAEIELAGPAGRRRLTADAFFEGLYTTARRPDELVVGVHVPRLGPDTRFGFDEVARRHGDYAILGLAARALVVDGCIKDCRLVYFGAGARPVVATAAQAALKGAALDDGHAHGRAAAAVMGELAIDPDLRYGATYKRQLATALLKRIIGQWKAPQ